MPQLPGKAFVVCSSLNMDLLSHLPSSYHSCQSSDWTINAVNFLQTKNASLQMQGLPHHKVNSCFAFFLVELNILESSKFKATNVIKQILLIYFAHLFCQ